jgi:hypothetical protein
MSWRTRQNVTRLEAFGRQFAEDGRRNKSGEDMKAIDFVVRDSANAVERGVVPDAAEVTTIRAAAGDEISLNLRQVDLRGFQRSGDALMVGSLSSRIISTPTARRTGFSFQPMAISTRWHWSRLPPGRCIRNTDRPSNGASGARRTI